MLNRSSKAKYLSSREGAVRHRKRAVVGYGGIAIIILGLCYLFIWQRVKTLQLAEERSHRQQSVNQMTEKCRALEYEIEELSSMKRVREFAVNDLGLLAPGEMPAVRLAEKLAAPIDSVKIIPATAKIKKSATIRKSDLKKSKKK